MPGAARQDVIEAIERRVARLVIDKAEGADAYKLERRAVEAQKDASALLAANLNGKNSERLRHIIDVLDSEVFRDFASVTARLLA